MPRSSGFPRPLAPLLLLALVLAACADGGTPAVAGLNLPGGEVVLAIGETARPDSSGLTITFDAVSGDSRCPARVQCVQAGSAVVALRVEKGSTMRSLELQTLDHSTADFAGYRLTISELTPQPVVGSIPTPQASYRLHLKVEPIPN